MIGQKKLKLKKSMHHVISRSVTSFVEYPWTTTEILTSFYSYGQKPLTENSVTYLKRKYATVQRQFPNTFTEVYLNNLVHLVEADNKGASSAATLLPDLQELDEVYTKDDLDKVEEKLKLVSFRHIWILRVKIQVQYGTIVVHSTVIAFKLSLALFNLTLPR